MTFTYRHTRRTAYLDYVVQAIVNNLPPLLFLTFRDQFGISLEKIGLLISVNFIIQIVVDFISAKYIDKIGYRAGIIAANLCACFGLVLLGILPFLIDPYTGLLIAISVGAVGGGLLEVLVSPIVEALPGDSKESSMSLLHSFYCWGHVAVVLLSTVYFLLVGMTAWQYLPMLWAVVPLCDAFLFIKVPIRTLSDNAPTVPLRKTFGSGIFWLFFFCMICAGASEQAMSQWASFFAEAGLGVSKTVGDLLGPCAFAALMGLARFGFGIKSQKLHLKNLLPLSTFLCIGSYLLAVFAPTPLLSLIGCGCCGLSVALMWPGIFSLATKQFPQGGTAMFALLALAGDLGCSAGPGMVGWISEQKTSLLENTVYGNVSMKTGLLFAVLFPVVLFILLLILRKKKSASLTQQQT